MFYLYKFNTNIKFSVSLKLISKILPKKIFVGENLKFVKNLKKNYSEMFNFRFLLLVLISTYLLLLTNACKDALSLDPNVKLTLINPSNKVVRDTVYLYPGSKDDSTYVIIIRYENEKDSLLKVIDSLRNFYYPKLNPNVVNIDSNIITKSIYFTNDLGFDQIKTTKWNYNRKQLSVRMDTVQNWPVVSLNFGFENISIPDFTKQDFVIKNYNISTEKIGVLKPVELKPKSLNEKNFYDINIIDSLGNIYNNHNSVQNTRVWFSDMNINRLTKNMVKHSFVINFETIVSNKKSKIVLRGNTYISYY